MRSRFRLFGAAIYLVSAAVFADNRNPLHDIHYGAMDISRTTANEVEIPYRPGEGRAIHDRRISPFGRYLVFIESEDSNWGGWKPDTTDILVTDLATGMTSRVNDDNDAYRYLDPQVSDNGFVVYVRTPSGFYTNRAAHEVLLYDPMTKLSTRLDQDCASRSPVPGATRPSVSGGSLLYNPGRDVAISGDGRFIAYENPCFSDSLSGESIEINIYDRLNNITTMVATGGGRNAAVWMGISGRVAKYRLPSTENEQFTIKHLDQATGEVGAYDSIDCVDQDGDGWGGVKLSGKSCRIDRFEVDLPVCDYVAAVSSKGADTCAYSRSDALSGAQGNCTDWSQWGSACRDEYEEHRTRIVDAYLGQMAELVTVAEEPVSTGISVENNNGCDYSDAHLYDGWGWNESTGQGCAPLENETTGQVTTEENSDSVVEPDGTISADGNENDPVAPTELNSGNSEQQADAGSSGAGTADQFLALMLFYLLYARCKNRQPLHV